MPSRRKPCQYKKTPNYQLNPKDMTSMQPLQSIAYWVEDECVSANCCSKIAWYVSAWFHGQQHVAGKVFIFTLLKDLHTDRENPNQFACLWCISEKLEESLLLGGWCGEKARTAALEVVRQPRDWEDNIPSRILRYETRSSKKSCLLLEHLGTTRHRGRWAGGNCQEPQSVQESLVLEVFCFMR